MPEPAIQPNRIVRPDPDPTERTVDLLEQSIEEINRDLALRAEIRQREHASLQELIESRMGSNEELALERVASIRREIAINEAHRLELKSDSEKTLNTATIAAEKAVQAALAAAEKARDQQTIASQLATTKAEEASKEQLKQQGETFTTGIAGLSSGLSDVKTAVSELRAERRGGQEQVIVARDTASDLKPLVDAVMALTLSRASDTGGKAQIVETQAANRNTGLWVGLGIAGAGGFISFAMAVIAIVEKFAITGR